MTRYSRRKPSTRTAAAPRAPRGPLPPPCAPAASRHGGERGERGAGLRAGHRGGALNYNRRDFQLLLQSV